MLPPTDASASAILSAIADRAEELMQQQRQTTQTGLLNLPTKVEGRVFRRLHQFAQLPDEIKAQADAVAVYLGSPRIIDTLFPKHHWFLRRRHGAVGPIVRGQALVAEVLKFLVTSGAANASEHTARQLADTLVLSGFLSPVHEPEDESQRLSEDQQLVPRTYIQPRAFYELVSSAVLNAIQRYHQSQDQRPHAEPQCEPEVEVERLENKTSTEETSLSVWDVVDGAIRAGHVYRKQPPSTLWTLLSCCLASPLGHEIPKYMVVNRLPYKSVFVFRDDVARQAIARVYLPDAMVQYEGGSEASPMFHGLKLWTDLHTERLDFLATADQHEWLLAVLDGGARYKEAHREIGLIIRSPFYAQHDVLASSTSNKRDVAMGELIRGRVVILVNVASRDPEAALQYPELVALWDHYHADGLEILACPSDQFLGLEFATDHEIVQHVRAAYHVQFPIFTKRDVNGPQAREPFLYCNAHLPGAFGPFTEWNFTKFLIDRNGKPYRRYETRILPNEMEGDIRRLLGRHRRVRRSYVPPPQGVQEVQRQLEPDRIANEIESSTSCQRQRPGHTEGTNANTNTNTNTNTNANANANANDDKPKP